LSDEVVTGSPVSYREVGEDHAGQRLDNFLLRELRGVPRTRLYRALRTGEIRVNKRRAKPDQRLVAGDSIRLPPLTGVRDPEAESPAAPAFWQRELAGRIVFEDEGLMVLDKPAGLAVHGGSGLSYGLIETLRQMRPEGGFLELVHRLDRDTSGCLLIARKPAVLRDLHAQLRGDGVDKRYVALAEGAWPRYCRLVSAALHRNVLQSGERMVRVSQEGKASQTRFVVRERLSGSTLIEAQPLTGRTHQIRVHAQHAGHPLLGDAKYGSDGGIALARAIGLKRLFLHAESLTFRYGGKSIRIEAPLAIELQAALERLRAQGNGSIRNMDKRGPDAR